MRESYSKTRVLITVMTYPHPSTSYRELVCTAGITDTNEWIRLYPVDYRYMPRNQWFHKYQWIEVELGDRGHHGDRRKESHQPRVESILPLGEPLSPADGWAKRRRVIDALPVNTIQELRELHTLDRTSLGIVRPTCTLDVKVEDAPRVWKPKWEQVLNQMTLFGPQPKPLAKIPHKFSYVFECQDSSSSHSAAILDWELGALYLRERDRLGSESEAAKSVRNKFLYEICAPDRDVRFFMGTVLPYNTWVVLGVFWPPRNYQTGFDLG